jgi:hypothetical protein
MVMDGRRLRRLSHLPPGLWASKQVVYAVVNDPSRRPAESVRGQIIASRRKAGDVEYPQTVFQIPAANFD